MDFEGILREAQKKHSMTYFRLVQACALLSVIAASPKLKKREVQEFAATIGHLLVDIIGDVYNGPARFDGDVLNEMRRLEGVMFAGYETETNEKVKAGLASIATQVKDVADLFEADLKCGGSRTNTVC